MSNTDRKNPDSARLVRVETRLTNLGRWMGVDLRVPPPANEPDQPVFIDEGKVYATAKCTLGSLLLAVRKQHWPDDYDEAPLIINGIEVGVVATHVGDHSN